jgi:hypothetical protein
VPQVREQQGHDTVFVDIALLPEVRPQRGQDARFIGDIEIRPEICQAVSQRAIHGCLRSVVDPKRSVSAPVLHGRRDALVALRRIMRPIGDAQALSISFLWRRRWRRLGLGRGGRAHGLRVRRMLFMKG